MWLITEFKKRYLFFALFLYAATMGLSITTTNIFALVLIAAFIIHDQFTNLIEGVRNDVLQKALFCYFVMILLSMFQESSLQEAFDLFTKRFLILLPLFFYNLSVSHTEKEKIFKIYIFSVIAGCLLGLLKTMGKLNEIENFYDFSWHLSINSIFSSNYMALYIAFAVILLFHDLLNESKLFDRKYSLLIILLLFIYNAILASRTAFFSMILLCFIYLAIKSLKNKKLIIYLFIFCGLVLASIVTVPYFKNRIVVLFEFGLQADPRHYEYLASENIFKSHPILGIGHTGTDKAFMDQYKEMGYEEGVINGYNAHSQYIQTALTFGLVGLTVFLGMYSILVVKAFKKKDFLAVAFILLFIICSLTESLLERNKGIIFFTFFAGLLIVAKSPEEKEIHHHPDINSEGS